MCLPPGAEPDESPRAGAVTRAEWGRVLSRGRYARDQLECLPMFRAAIVLGTGLLSCTPSASSSALKPGKADAPSASSSATPAPAQMGLTPAPAPASVSVAAGQPSGEPGTCEERSKLPSRAEENAGWVADVSLNVAYGLQVMSCAQMARDRGPEDFFGQQTFVACAPPRFCSAGPDGRPNNADDACTPLVEGQSTGPRSLPRGWVRHFLTIHKEMEPGCQSAESAVVAFYAGLMRRDGSHLAALPPASEWDETLKRKLKKYARVDLVAARLEGMRCDGRGRCAFQLWFSVRAGEHASSGTDQGILAQRDGRWVVARPPS